jgi:hypothetical protein
MNLKPRLRVRIKKIDQSLKRTLLMKRRRREKVMVAMERRITREQRSGKSYMGV